MFFFLSWLLMSATLFPIFVGYFASFLCLLWFLKGSHWRMAFASDIADGPGHDKGKLLAELRRVFAPVHVGVLLYFLSFLLAAILAYFFSPYSGSFATVARKMSHLGLKMALVWYVLSGSFLVATARGWRLDKVARAWLILLLLNFAYMVLQRYSGINLSEGVEAQLGTHRFSYGVFRVSGFMGHPLTLAYNLVLLLSVAATFVFRTRYFPTKAGRRLWAAILGVLLISLLVTGSRWPVCVALLSVGLPEVRRLWRWRVHLAVFTVFLLMFLWMEGSTLSRMGEVFATNVPLAERFPRLTFWQAHWRMFLDFPWHGIGVTANDTAKDHYYNMVGANDKLYIAHNIFLQTLADSGLIGAAGLVALLVSIGVAAALIVRRGGTSGLTYLLVGAILSGMMQNTLRDSEYLFAFWLCTTLLIVHACVQIVHQQTPKEPWKKTD